MAMSLTSRFSFTSLRYSCPDNESTWITLLSDEVSTNDVTQPQN